MAKFKIGCFYSEGTEYQNIYQNQLARSCEEYNLELEVMSTPNYHSWYRNVAEKPRVIMEMLDLLVSNNTALVFLDADCTITQYPYLFEEIPEEYDIAFHTLNWNEWYGYKNHSATRELLTGTMFFRKRKVVRELCREWYLQATQTMEWEQKVLEKVIKNHDVKIFNLPIEYCFMDSRPGNKPPLIKTDPVIVHHQASRKLKRIIK